MVNVFVSMITYKAKTQYEHLSNPRLTKGGGYHPKSRIFPCRPKTKQKVTKTI